METRQQFGRRSYSKSRVQEEYGAIVWALKLGGDINENFKGGGRARDVLFERMEANGYHFDKKQYGNRILALVSSRHIKTLKDDSGRLFYMQLLGNASDYPNPYEGNFVGGVTEASKPSVVPAEKVEVLDASGYQLIGSQRDLPISQRLRLIAELTHSINADMGKISEVFS